jgi:hypothetical protein
MIEGLFDGKRIRLLHDCSRSIRSRPGAWWRRPAAMGGAAASASSQANAPDAVTPIVTSWGATTLGAKRDAATPMVQRNPDSFVVTS